MTPRPIAAICGAQSDVSAVVFVEWWAFANLCQRAESSYYPVWTGTPFITLLMRRIFYVPRLNPVTIHGMWIWLLPACVVAYHAYDHSCGWTNKQVLWQRLRRRADAVLAGEIPWTRESWVEQISGELVNCPFGVHVLQLLNLDAAGATAAKLLDFSGSKTMGFGLYNLVGLLDIALTGWPSFGFLHRICRSRLPDHCAGRLATKPAPAALVVAAQAARRNLEKNISRTSRTSRTSDGLVNDLDLLNELRMALERIRKMWFLRWEGNDMSDESLVSRWLGLDLQQPCCQMWAELDSLQGSLRRRFEMPCASGHRRSDGAVCPACRLPAQAFWLEEREEAELALAEVSKVRHPAQRFPRTHDLDISQDFPGSFAIATVLTSEDLFRSIRHDGQGSGHSGDEDVADANAIVLAYVDALRTLAFSIQKTSFQKPLLVLLSLRTGESLPKEAQDSLEALEEHGLTKLLHLPVPPQHLWPRAWGKLQLWKPRGYDLILYMDADTLVLDNLEGLFHAATAMGPNFSVAAAVTRSMMGLNGGVMLLRPSLHIFNALQQSLEELPSWQGISRWTGRPWWNAPPVQTLDASNETVSDFGSYGDQDHLNEWLATSFDFHGELMLDGSACRKQPWHVSYDAVRADGPKVTASLGGFCTLPVGFNFCATAGCLRQLALGEHALAREALVSATDPNGPTEAMVPGVQVLHWPGALRKPWQRCYPATRSRLDVLWWQVFDEACATAPAKAPCRVRCFD
eukprot:s1226_g34.t1